MTINECALVTCKRLGGHYLHEIQFYKFHQLLCLISVKVFKTVCEILCYSICAQKEEHSVLFASILQMSWLISYDKINKISIR